MSLGRAFSIFTLAVATTLGACRSPDATNDCMLQLALVYTRDSVSVGDTLKLFARALPMLPPGGGCGPAAVTWSLSDSTLASLAGTLDGNALLTARRPGTLTVRAHGTARGHEDDASATIRIGSANPDEGGFMSITAVTDTFGVYVDLARLRGTIVVTANASFPPPDILLMGFQVDSVGMCLVPPPIRSRPISCRMDLDQTRDGAWRFPAGTHVLSATVRDSAGHARLSTSQAIVVAR